MLPSNPDSIGSSKAQYEKTQVGSSPSIMSRIVKKVSNIRIRKNSTKDDIINSVPRSSIEASGDSNTKSKYLHNLITTVKKELHTQEKSSLFEEKIHPKIDEARNEIEHLSQFKGVLLQRMSDYHASEESLHQELKDAAVMHAYLVKHANKMLKGGEDVPEKIERLEKVIGLNKNAIIQLTSLQNEINQIDTKISLLYEKKAILKKIDQINKLEVSLEKILESPEKKFELLNNLSNHDKINKKDKSTVDEFIGNLHTKPLLEQRLNKINKQLMNKKERTQDWQKFVSRPPPKR